MKAEVHIIDLKEEDESIYKEENEGKDELEDEKVEDTVLEAKFVAKKIRELIDKRISCV